MWVVALFLRTRPGIESLCSFPFNARTGHRQAISADDSEFLVASRLDLKDKTPIAIGDSGITYRYTIYGCGRQMRNGFRACLDVAGQSYLLWVGPSHSSHTIPIPIPFPIPFLIRIRPIPFVYIYFSGLYLKLSATTSRSCCFISSLISISRRKV